MNDDEKDDDERLADLEEKLEKLRDDVADLKDHVDDKEDSRHNRRMELIGAIAVPIVTAVIGFFLDRWFNKPPRWRNPF